MAERRGPSWTGAGDALPLEERIDQLFYAVSAEPAGDHQLADELSASRVAEDVRRFMRATRAPAARWPQRAGARSAAAAGLERILECSALRLRIAARGISWPISRAAGLGALAAFAICAGGTALLLSVGRDLGAARGEFRGALRLAASDPAPLVFAAIAEPWGREGGESWYLRVARALPAATRPVSGRSRSDAVEAVRFLATAGKLRAAESWYRSSVPARVR